MEYRVPVGCFDDLGDERVLDIRELAVGTDGKRLYLFAPSLAREVSVVTPHMLNPVSEAPNLARFLTMVSLGGVRPFTPWHWGRLSVLPRLPRVRYGRTIVAPAKWRPDPALCAADSSWSEWQQALLRWRERLEVPRHVRVGVYDNHVELDLCDEIQQRILRDHLRQVAVPVWESPMTYGGLGVTSGRFNEFVVPLTSTQARQSVRGGSAPGSTTSQPHSRSLSLPRHQPGGEWLYAKAYVLTDLQDAFLARHVTSLVSAMPATVDRWFFVRYRDSKPHLRLRFHGPAEGIRSDALQVLHDWADTGIHTGLIGGLTLDGYEPEIDRYGGLEAMSQAEQLFTADSAAVLGQLELRTNERNLAMPIETLAAMNYADILGSLDSSGAWDWQQWFLDMFPIELSNAVRPAERDAAARWIDPLLQGDRLSEEPNGTRLLELWMPRRNAAQGYGECIFVGTDRMHEQGVMSVLHMHANRLLGLDRNAEQKSYGLLRAALRRHLGERTHRHGQHGRHG